jgi:dTDP-4-dehydrorhamnose reductase
MKILITGSKGQLGSEIKSLAGEFPSLNCIYTDLPELDITNEGDIEGFFHKEKPEIIINCAAYTAVDKAEEETLQAGRINRDAVRNLANACKKHEASFIHISTDYVFDGTNHKPYTEDDPVNPSSVYGVTKMEGEGEILISGANSIIIRTSWLYSTFGNNFVKSMIRLGKEKNELGIIFDQVGTPTYAADLAHAALSIAAKTAINQSAFVPGIYNYSNEGVASWYDFTLAIFELCGIKNCIVKPIKTIDYPTPAKRPAYSLLDKSKIKSTFNIEIPYWRKSLKRCIDKLNSITV